MKLLNNFRSSILLASLSVLLFATTSCEDKIEREDSPAYNTSSSNVYFAASNKSSVILGVDAKSFEVTISREKSTAAQTVALSCESVFGDTIVVPASVSFAAGESQKKITITVSNMKLMKSYHLAIAIDREQTKPYVAQTVYPRYELNVLKEDFAPYASGTYSDLFFAPGDDYISWPLTLEYSPMTQVYRLKKCWNYEGYDVTFKWDKASKVTMIGTAVDDFIAIKTGYVHAKYGMVSAYYSTVTYNAATKTFTFPIDWRVSAGSFGAYDDYYKITSLL